MHITASPGSLIRTPDRRDWRVVDCGTEAAFLAVPAQQRTDREPGLVSRAGCVVVREAAR